MNQIEKEIDNNITILLIEKEIDNDITILLNKYRKILESDYAYEKDYTGKIIGNNISVISPIIKFIHVLSPYQQYNKHYK